MKWSLTALLIGYFLDLCFGDPYRMPHIIRGIGIEIQLLENAIRSLFPKNAKAEWYGGCALTFTMIMTAVICPALILYVTQRIHPFVRLAAESIICYQMLAAKSLYKESMKVHEKLEKDDLPGARNAVSMIVGRDTDKLTKKGVAKAAVETVAENTSDGVIAPMFYMALFGAVGGVVYKTINTMDSMIGYRNKKYEYFGKAAAKSDDIVNYIPARLSGIFMLMASFFLGFNYKNAWKIYKRDRKKTSSPNAGQTEAVCAGALDIELLGDAYYFGKLHQKKTIGDPKREIDKEDIKHANTLMYAAEFIALVLFTGIKLIFIT